MDKDRQEGEMILEKRSVRLCERISTLDSLIKEIWEQQRSKEHFTRLPSSVQSLVQYKKERTQ
jgi:Zn-dependent M32 family carboxypeptidase